MSRAQGGKLLGHVRFVGMRYLHEPDSRTDADSTSTTTIFPSPCRTWLPRIGRSAHVLGGPWMVEEWGRKSWLICQSALRGYISWAHSTQ